MGLYLGKQHDKIAATQRGMEVERMRETKGEIFFYSQLIDVQYEIKNKSSQ